LPTLHQAEWCPFSSAVREVLTELGVDSSPATCPFIAHYIERHPEYEQLVAPGYRGH
jgi:hypothetical protein